jgi:hypothetical protein
MLLARAHIEHSQPGVLLSQTPKFYRRNEDPGILLVAVFDVLNDVRHAQIIIPPAEIVQSLLGREAAATATANVKTPEQSSLRAGELLQHCLHGAFGSDGFSGGSHA